MHKSYKLPKLDTKATWRAMPAPSVASTTAATYAAQLPASMVMSPPPGRSSYSEYLWQAINMTSQRNHLWDDIWTFNGNVSAFWLQLILRVPVPMTHMTDKNKGYCFTSGVVVVCCVQHM